MNLPQLLFYAGPLYRGEGTEEFTDNTNDQVELTVDSYWTGWVGTEGRGAGGGRGTGRQENRGQWWGSSYCVIE